MHFLFQSSIKDDPFGIVVIILFVVGFICYFIPSIIAIFRGKSNTIAIIALNFFLGWSLIGWVVSLVWSLSKDQPAQRIVVQQQKQDDTIDKLTKLKDLRDSGSITQEEFEQQKRQLL
ncbi:superinfection immunity protein [Aquimarina algicola]|uniref:Superinfection immunity protein n=1 Tax=Aquimarina algicola TaxID=2589995 RepID=A0A504J8F3_9FLAO|nr:superinfection immunity protein [Aquimarina algicola]TPN82471.1 superinfection immunity protein [Aquimarina algicola]